MYSKLIKMGMASVIAITSVSSAFAGNPVVTKGAKISKGGAKVSNHLGRGRHAIATVSTKRNDFIVNVRFENHHRSRGWTLCTTVTMLSKAGKPITSKTVKRGIKPKGFRGYRVANASMKFPGLAAKAGGVLVKSWRCSTKRFVPEGIENVVKHRGLIGRIFGVQIP